LRTVKWHANGELALASDSEVYLLDAREASDAFHGTPVPLNNLGQVAKVFSIPSVSLSTAYSTNVTQLVSSRWSVSLLTTRTMRLPQSLSIRSFGYGRSKSSTLFGKVPSQGKASLRQSMYSMSESLLVASKAQFSNCLPRSPLPFFQRLGSSAA
jgi:hypothetical protein